MKGQTSAMPESELRYMRMAIDLGKRSVPEDGRSHPKVGAVIVRNGEILGEAFRGEMGVGDHAEYTLFEKKLPGIDVQGTTLFTTLEPCTSRGKRKPCSDWIVEKGVANVVIGILDPNPRIYGKGAAKLRESGIRVSYFPVELRTEIETDNRNFIQQFRANPLPEGRATFNYGDNSGIYTIGNSDFVFDTHWSKRSDRSIYVYKDSTNLAGVAVAVDAKQLFDIVDASVYDFSSRVRYVHEGQFVVLQNTAGYFAVLHVIDVRDQERSDSCDELTFDYWILADKTRDFSSERNS